MTEQPLTSLLYDHDLKVWPEFFEPLMTGEKTFEVRREDRPFKVGDRLVLKEWSQRDGYSGRKVYRTVTYIMAGPLFGIAPEHIVMGLAANASESLPSGGGLTPDEIDWIDDMTEHYASSSPGNAAPRTVDDIPHLDVSPEEAATMLAALDSEAHDDIEALRAAAKALADGVLAFQSGHVLEMLATDLRSRLASSSRQQEAGIDLPNISEIAKGLHDAGIGCKPNVPFCRASHIGHATRLYDALAHNDEPTAGDPT